MHSIAHRAAIVVACASLGLLALGFGSASAYSYCGSLIANGVWCGDPTNRAYNYNSASYTGAGSVWVCERLVIADTTTQRESPFCGYNFVERSFGPYAYLTEPQVQHQTGANHTIYGYATA
jgi:hypothetical protein